MGYDFYRDSGREEVSYWCRFVRRWFSENYPGKTLSPDRAILIPDSSGDPGLFTIDSSQDARTMTKRFSVEIHNGSQDAISWEQGGMKKNIMNRFLYRAIEGKNNA